MIESTYRQFLREVVAALIDKTKDESLYEEGDIHSAGYRMALYSVLHTIENEAIAWDLSPSDIGLNGFSSDDWLMEGLYYWKRRNRSN